MILINVTREKSHRSRYRSRGSLAFSCVLLRLTVNTSEYLTEIVSGLAICEGEGT